MFINVGLFVLFKKEKRKINQKRGNNTDKVKGLRGNICGGRGEGKGREGVIIYN